MMHNLVAKTKTLVTAWELIRRLHAACPVNDFVVVLRTEDAAPEVHPVGPFHPVDKKRAKEIVKNFKEEK